MVNQFFAVIKDGKLMPQVYLTYMSAVQSTLDKDGMFGYDKIVGVDMTTLEVSVLEGVGPTQAIMEGMAKK